MLSVIRKVKVHVFAPNIVNGISFYGFEAGQTKASLVYFVHDGQRALTLVLLRLVSNLTKTIIQSEPIKTDEFAFCHTFCA